MAAATLARLSAGLAARKYSAVELTREALTRIERTPAAAQCAGHA